MRSKTYTFLGLKFPVDIPATNEEYDQLAGRVNAAAEDGADNVVYRSVANDVRPLLCAGIEKLTDIRRLRKFEKDEKTGELTELVDDFAEKESVYIDRVVAQTGQPIESFQVVADEVSVKVNSDAELKFDPKRRERQAPTPKTPPKRVYAQVDALVAAGVAEQTAASLSILLNRTVTSEREDLARAIHEDILNEQRKVQGKWAVQPAA